MMRASSFTEEDRAFMREAIREAALDARSFKVGAVIVRDGVEIGRAHGQADTGAHAEFCAIRICLDKGLDLVGATIYTTLEPCVAHARGVNTTACSIAILTNGFGRVVIGLLDPNPKVHRRGLSTLQTSHCDVALCNDASLQAQIRTQSWAFLSRTWPRFRGHPLFPLEPFEGRVAERELLSQWVTRHGEYAGQPILQLIAIGGMGKSSLSWLWAKHDVAGEETAGRSRESEDTLKRCRVGEGWIGRILWFSFYQHEGGGDFLRFLDVAIDHLSCGTKSRDDYAFEATIDYAALVDDLIGIMQNDPCLIVCDGAERLLREYAGPGAAYKEERNEDVVAREPASLGCIELRAAQFLRQAAAQNVSKVLLVSRLPFRDLDGLEGVGITRLEGLDERSALQFLRGRGLRGPDSVLMQAADLYERHPLSLSNLAASLLDDFQPTCAIGGSLPDDPGLPVDERRRHVLERAFSRRSSARQTLLARIAAVRGVATRDVVALLADGIPGLNSRKLGMDVAELRRHGLIRGSPDDDLLDMHPIVRQYAYKTLADKLGVHRLLAEYFGQIAESIVEGRTVRFEDLAQRLEHFHQLACAQAFDEANQVYHSGPPGKSLNDVLFFELCRFHSCIESLEALFPDGIDQPPGVAAPARGPLLNDLALAYRKTGATAVGLQLAVLAVAANRALLDDPERAAASALETSLPYLVRGDLGREMFEVGLGGEFLDAARQTFLSVGSIFNRGRLALSLENLGHAHLIHGDLADAHRILKDSLQEYARAHRMLIKAAGEQYSQREIANEFANPVNEYLGEMYCHMGQFRKAEQYLKNSKAECKGREDLQGVVTASLGLGDVALRRNDWRTAESLAFEIDAAVVEMNRTGMRRPGSRVRQQTLLGSALLLKGEAPTAVSQLEQALTHCRRVGLVEIEAPILLAYAAALLKEVGEADKRIESVAQEALEISVWCEYRLEEAEARLFLADLYARMGDTEKAMLHAERAVTRAACGVDPVRSRYYFKPVWTAAATLRARLIAGR